MNEVKSQSRSQRFVLIAILASAALLGGCSADAMEPAVMDKQPPEAAIDESVPKAERSPVAKPVYADTPKFWRDVPEMSSFHGYQNGLRWRLRASGIELQDAKIEGQQVNTDVIRKVWGSYGSMIETWSARYGVPIELIITAVSVESKGNPTAKNGRNIGLMQILVPTARSVLSDPTITEKLLYDPNINIRAGTAYIARQRKSTQYDPPKVAATYNAGSLRSASNRWGMKQYGPHLDKTVVWFNAILAFLASQHKIPQMSFASYFRNHP